METEFSSNCRKRKHLLLHSVARTYAITQAGDLRNFHQQSEFRLPILPNLPSFRIRHSDERKSQLITH